MSQDEIEQALGAAEDEDDRQAGQDLRVEQAAQVEEFDENIPWDEKEAAERDSQQSRLEQHLAMIDKEVGHLGGQPGMVGERLSVEVEKVW